jgi:hypothetical protein
MQDILLADNLDLLIEGGDFVVGEADEQNVQLILYAATGDFRENPEIGVDIEAHIKAPRLEALKASIIENLQNDRYFIESLQINEDLSLNLKVNARRL